jgi:Fe-S cluster assembly protein SufB
MSKDNIILDKITNSDYKYGFSSKIYSDELPKGINEFIIRLISKKKKNHNGY